MPIFQLAINVTNLDEARAFCGDLLGCAEGRSTETWVDYNFFGHMFFCDPSGNPIEIKGFADMSGVFAT